VEIVATPADDEGQAHKGSQLSSDWLLPSGKIAFGFLEKIANRRAAIAHHGPSDVRDSRRSTVGWFEASDGWDENVALTRSRHLIDGSLSLDGFRSGLCVPKTSSEYDAVMESAKLAG
jgi:hypothetical protein